MSNKTSKKIKDAVKRERSALASMQAGSKLVEHTNAAKKNKWSWGDMIKGGLATALDLAPALLPLFLSSHASASAVRAAAPPGVVATTAPLASGIGTIGQMSGLKGVRVMGKDRHGNVNHIRVTTFDMLASISSAAFSAGDEVYSAYLAPMDPAMDGTKFSQWGSAWQRYKIARSAIIYEPTCPATTTGALSGCIFNDPTTELASLGAIQAERVVASEPGSDTWTVWSAGAVSAWAVPGQDPYYTEPNGSDIRLTVQGKIAIIAAADISGGVSPGNIYLAAETEFWLPSLDDTIGIGAAFHLDSTDTVASLSRPRLPEAGSWVYDAWSTTTGMFNNTGGHFYLNGTYTYSGTSRSGAVLMDLPSGIYSVQLFCSGTTVTNAPTTCVADELVILGGGAIGSSLSTGNATTEGMICYQVYVPPCPTGTPCIGFRMYFDALTQGAINVYRISDWVNTAALSLKQQREDRLTRRTAQGISRQQVSEVAALRSQVAQLIAARVESLSAPHWAHSSGVPSATVAPSPLPSFLPHSSSPYTATRQ